MSKPKKINPRRRTATMADVKRAELEVKPVHMRHAIELVLYLLLDKHDAPKEDVQQLSREISRVAEQIADGRLSWSYIETVLKENEVEVRLR